MPARVVAGSRRKADSGGLIRVLVVDDHPLWRQTLKHLLQHSGRAQVVAEAGDGEAVVELARRHGADVVLMDVDVPLVNGIEATRQIIAEQPDARVLVLSSSAAPRQVREAVRAGARGYLLKTALPEEVVDALERVHRGELVFPPGQADVVLGELRGESGSEERGPLGELTERERAVLALMADGHSNRAIAGQLFLSTKTVEAHLASLFAKLGLETTADHHRRVLAVVTYLRSRDQGVSLGEPPG